MDLEWNDEKAATNLQKHGIDLADAGLALEDPLALTTEDPDSQGERRFISVGSDPYGRLLTVVYTWRGERIRLISARKATRGERVQYESGHRMERP